MRYLFILLFISFVRLPILAQPSAPVQQTRFTLKAVDEKTIADVPARFVIQGQLARKEWTGVSQVGQPFTFTLTQADTLTVIARAPGYDESEVVMVVSCDTCANYEYAVELAKAEKPDSVFRNLRVNQALRLDNVYFDQSSYGLRSESFPQLDKLVRTLAETPKLAIEIAGHTDNVGDRRLNQALSENRAKIISNYLIRNGIAKERLRYAGYGGSRPSAPNDSEENKRKNRRVEFVVLAI